MKKLVLSALLFIAFQTTSLAQSAFTVQGNVFVPTGELSRDLSGAWGGGFSLEFVHKLKPSLAIGTRYGYFRYGKDRRTEALGGELGTREVTWRNQMYNLLGFVRFYPMREGPFRPYLDIMGGRTWVHSDAHYVLTEAEGALDHDDEECPDNTRILDKVVDGTWSYGLGGGVEIELRNEILLDFSVTPLRGARAEVITANATENSRQSERYGFNVRRGRFDYMSINFSVKIPLVILNRWYAD